MNEDPNSVEQENLGSDHDIEPKIPWHFWLFVALAGIYLVFRIFEFVVLGFKAIF